MGRGGRGGKGGHHNKQALAGPKTSLMAREFIPLLLEPRSQPPRFALLSEQVFPNPPLVGSASSDVARDQDGATHPQHNPPPSSDVLLPQGAGPAVGAPVDYESKPVVLPAATVHAAGLSDAEETKPTL